ncbi:hypothetical protein V6Z11_D10G211800 [Gossypium hirsutum]
MYKPKYARAQSIKQAQYSEKKNKKQKNLALSSKPPATAPNAFSKRPSAARLGLISPPRTRFSPRTPAKTRTQRVTERRNRKKIAFRFDYFSISGYKRPFILCK